MFLQDFFCYALSVGCSSDGAAVAHNAKNRAVTVVLALKEGA